MITKRLIGGVFATLLIAGICFFIPPAHAYDSGSTGADGAFNPTVNTTITLPDNGVLNYTTVNIPSGVTVYFKPNADNTPVFMLASGNVTIAGSINVNGKNAVLSASGQSGPGGYTGGIGGYLNAIGGAGLGGGGGKTCTKVAAATMDWAAGGGGGGYSSSGATAYTKYSDQSKGGGGGTTYGNVKLSPVIGGSGGGGGCGAWSGNGGGGGGGGGAILIASSGTINISGSVRANGGNGANGRPENIGPRYGGGGGGSGGAIKLIADTVKGEGAITATGGTGGDSYGDWTNGGNGGKGRIAINANTVIRTANTDPNFVYGVPTAVFPSIIPTLKIVAIGGISVPDSPSGNYGTADVVLPSGSTNPVAISIQATHIPAGSTVKLIATPLYGDFTTATATLSGTDASSSATVNISLSTKEISVITTTVSFTTLIAAIDAPVNTDGEDIVMVRVDSELGKKSSVTYITESGREIS